NAGANDITLNNAGNDFNTLLLSAKNAQITDQNALTLGTSNLTNDLTITANGNVTQTGAINSNGLALLGSGKFNLTNPGNSITTIIANTTNDISFVNSKTLTVGTVNPIGITTTGTVFLQALTGDIILDKAVQSTATNTAITLVAEDNFINNFGVGALSASNGRWLVYATSPTGNVNGHSLLGGSQQFNSPYPTPAGFSGNGFLYKVSAPPIPPVVLSITEPVTFILDSLTFNELQWRDLSSMGETVLFLEKALLCVNTPMNQSSEESRLTQPIIIGNANLPNLMTEWLTGELPLCSASGAE
ncbi:MAG: hypothetical protein Q6I77_08780, partial [Gloeomargarita sp. DG_1_4_bins_134]